MKNNTVKLLCLLIALLTLFVSSCGHEHQWQDATCLKPQICTKCGQTVGEKQGHDWKSASCTQPKSCRFCDAYEGEALGHDFQNATCVTPKKCSRCQKTEGEAASHIWQAATCTQPSVCTVCNATSGSAIGHVLTETIVQIASSTQDGIKRFSCTGCDYSFQQAYTVSTKTAYEIYESAKLCIGEIITYDVSGNKLALGTGFAFSADGKILTNHHVIENASSIQITINDNTYRVERILSYNAAIDLAVLKINAENIPYLEMSDKTVRTGDTVYTFGSPKGLTATFSRGIVTYSDRVLEGIHYIQHDAAISKGNSGGPLIDEYGKVVGVNTMTVSDAQNLNFAITISELYTFYE